MLQAKNETGELTTLALLTKKEIETLRSRTTFYCPTCSLPVIVKAGPQTIPHFAHVSKQYCPANEGGEGPYHERGKLMLFTWLKEQGYQVMLEPYVPSINQRPDLLLIINNKKIAIEYQCARIPSDIIQARCHGYLQAGITPIWILGANLLKRKGGNHVKINGFVQQFIHQFNDAAPCMLYFFCSNSKQFISIYNLFLTTKSIAISDFQITSLSQLRFRDFFLTKSLQIRRLFYLWKQEKRKLRLAERGNRYGKDRLWLEWLYRKQAYVETMPSIIYLPIPAQYLMSTSPWDWQSRIVLDIILPMPLGNIFTLQDCESLLRNHLLSPQHFPLLKQRKSPIKQYLQLLIKLDVIKQVIPGQYQKTKSISFLKQVDAAIESDEAVMRQLEQGTIKKQA